MADDRGALRKVAWSELCPWLILLRTFSLSISLPVLSLATAGALLTPLGWLAAGLLFSSELRGGANPHLNNVPGVEELSGGTPPAQVPQQVEDVLQTAPRVLEPLYTQFIEPARMVFDENSSVRDLAYATFGGLWTLLVWSFFGGAITRIAAVDLGREERVGFSNALRFAKDKLVSFFLAPLFPLIGVALITLLVIPLGLLMKAGFGVVIAGVLWIFVLVGSLLITLLLLGLLVGWPLMWGAISTEGSDHFDALSRAFAYPFQRPLRYLLYVLFAAVLGALGLFVVSLFSEAVINFGYWSASWGSDAFSADGRMAEIRSAVEQTDPPREDTGWGLAVGAKLMGLSVGLVRAIAAGYMYSFFWCAATAIYLLLRRDVDHVDFDEVFVEDEDDRYDLPDLTRDSAGVAGVADEAPPPSEPAADEETDEKSDESA